MQIDLNECPGLMDLWRLGSETVTSAPPVCLCLSVCLPPPPQVLHTSMCCHICFTLLHILLIYCCFFNNNELSIVKSNILMWCDTGLWFGASEMKWKIKLKKWEHCKKALKSVLACYETLDKHGHKSSSVKLQYWNRAAFCSVRKIKTPIALQPLQKGTL